MDWIKQWQRMRKNILDTDNLLWEITDHIHASEGHHVKIFLFSPNCCADEEDFENIKKVATSLKKQ